MRTLICVLLLALPLTLNAAGGWEVTLPGGAMRFHGELIAEACRVDTSDRALTVDMGRLRTSRLNAPGEESDPVIFNVHLRDCRSDVSRYVSLAFIGVADHKNPELLAIAEGPDRATDVGIALFTTRNTLLPINAPPVKSAVLRDGETVLHFLAKYRATGHHVTGGKVDAQAWLLMVYE